MQWFMFKTTLKYLRYFMALCLPLYAIGSFITDLMRQSGGVIDGPLAHYLDYTFALNKIIIALLLSVFFIANFKLDFPKRVRRPISILCGFAFVLGLIGLVYLIRQFMFSSHIELRLSLIKLLIFQCAYLLATLLVFGKTINADWANIRSETDNA